MEELEEEVTPIFLENRDELVRKLLDDIRSGKKRLSYTSLSQFKESPKSFIDYKLKPKKTTPAMELGKIVHCMVLEPEKAKEKYVNDECIVKELIDAGSSKPRGTNKYKEWVAKQTAEIVPIDVYKQAQLMANAIRNNFASASKLCLIESFEQKLEFEHNGLKFVSYIDGIGHSGQGIIIDIKICKDANPEKFRREIVNNGYWLQSGVYCTPFGYPIPYFLIAVDRSGGVSVNQLEDSFIEYGMETFDKLTRDFNKCMDNNDFDKSFEYRSVSPDGSFMCSRPPYLN